MNLLKNLELKFQVFYVFLNPKISVYFSQWCLTVPQYFEDVNPIVIRQYAEIISMTDDLSKIANYLEIPLEIIYKVKKHIFINEHELDIPNYEEKTINHIRCNFTPDYEIADLWLKATNQSLQPREIIKFKRLIAHEYIEQALMAEGWPYRSPNAWRDHPIRGFGNWATPENYGAHDIAPNTNRPNPFSHWDTIIGKSAEGLILADNLSNLDELIEAIKKRI